MLCIKHVKYDEDAYRVGETGAPWTPGHHEQLDFLPNGLCY